MPYNFEATFTQPILAKLDAGLITGAADWADTITKAYIATIKAGLPQGTPPTLPAPGLAVPPSPPPPYPLGVAPFLTADSRSRSMYNVIYAYFYAKELKLEKDSIQNLATDVSALIQKIKIRTRRVKTLVDEINNVKAQLQELPTLLSEIIADIKGEVAATVEGLQDLEITLSSSRARLGPSVFDVLFREELLVYNAIKGFDAFNVSAIRSLINFIERYSQNKNTIVDAAQSESQLKNYIRRRLLQSARVLVRLAEGVVDPTKILDFVTQLGRTNRRVTQLAQRVSRFDLVVRYLQPRLRKLEIRKNALIKEIRLNLQTKLTALRDRLSAKIDGFTRKIREGKALRLFKSASNVLKDLKNKNTKKQKKLVKKIKALNQVVKKSFALYRLVDALTLGLQNELRDLINRIVAQGELALTTQPAREIAAANQYMQNLGLGEYSQLVAFVITQAKCDFDTFKRFFESKTIKLRQYMLEIASLDDRIQDLIDTIRQLGGDEKTPRRATKSRTAEWFKNEITSLGATLSRLGSKLKVKLRKVQLQAETKIKELQATLTQKLQKYAEDLEIFALRLVPLKSDVQDPKNKKLNAEAKRAIIKAKVQKLKKLLTLTPFVLRMAKGSAKLASNFANGNYGFSQNQQSINEILDGLYAYKTFDQSQPVVESLVQEKEKTKVHLKSLLVVEALALGLTQLFADARTTNFTQELDRFLALTKDPANIGLAAVSRLFKSPPKNVLELERVANELVLGGVQSSAAVSVLLRLERKYLNSSRETIKTILDIPDIQGTRHEPKLLKIKNALDKNQSFIVAALTLLIDVLVEVKNYIKTKVNKFVDKVKKFILEKKQKAQEDAERQLKKETSKKVNPDAAILSFTFGLAATLFWSGATWVGPTGTSHLTLTIGAFKSIKARSIDGASVTIREIAKSFEGQLANMRGIITPPAVTGISPLRFSGYK